MTPDAVQEIIRQAEVHADHIGVQLIVDWQEEQKRLTFTIRRLTSRERAGAEAITRLLELADAARIPVVLDVACSLPGLLRYYRRFGFMAHSANEAEEEAEVLRIDAARRHFLSNPHHRAEDFGVTFMWRETPSATAAA